MENTRTKKEGNWEEGGTRENGATPATQAQSSRSLTGSRRKEVFVKNDYELLEQRV